MDDSIMKEPAQKVAAWILDYGYITSKEITQLTGIKKQHNLLSYMTEHYTIYEISTNGYNLIYGLLTDKERD